ncbi:MAG: hypothetical protein JKY37_24355 [Nannocystaceae bacterium]|nr:hypothetical protein [Nannocystaceae bacterium]
MPQVSALDDYLPCPALMRWLPARLAGRSVQHAIAPGAPARLRRFVAQWPAFDADAERETTSHNESTADVLIIAATLRKPVCVDLLRGAAPGTILVELAAVGGLRIGERVFGIPARRSVRRLTGRRLGAWLETGLADVEQWLTTDPPDTFVTMGVCRSLPPTHAQS